MPLPRETQLTHGPGGRILTHCNVWSPDSDWIAFDTRSDPAGDHFDGTQIQMANVITKEERTLYESRNGAHCGVATWHPTEPKVIFILGPENPTPDWSYGPNHRQGVIVDMSNWSAAGPAALFSNAGGPPALQGIAEPMDARDLVPPFTPGALHGGTHLHLWHPNGDWISFTYEDALENQNLDEPPGLSRWSVDLARTTGINPVARGASASRNLGIGIPKSVTVPANHPRNHSGSHYSQLVTDAGSARSPLLRACEEAWVGSTRSLAFQGEIEHSKHGRIREVFLAEIQTPLPCPPNTDGAIRIRRLTDTTSHRFRGLTVTGPRHWLKSTPDGSRIGFLKKDDEGIVQFWTVTPMGEVKQITINPYPVSSAFTWHPDGQRVAFVMDGSVCLTNIDMGVTQRLTEPGAPIRPEACVVSPDGSRIAFVRNDGNNQICVLDI